MPCYTDPPTKEERLSKRLASHLCEVLFILEKENRLHEVSAKVNTWWTQHKKQDADRINSALTFNHTTVDKLTEYERYVINLKVSKPKSKKSKRGAKE